MIRWNWNPSRVCFVDLETQSSSNLRTDGAAKYLKHTDTRLLSAVFLLDDTLTVWVPPGRAPAGVFAECGWLDALVAPLKLRVETHTAETPPVALPGDATFCAHNAEGFDAPAWSTLIGTDAEWIDTIPMCRAAGLPAGLDRACKALGIEGKDAAGKDAAKMLWAHKPGKPPNIGTVSLWRLMLRYNVQDVLILRELYNRLQGEQDYERDLLGLHCEINSRGVPVDLRFAEIVRDLWTVAQAEARDEFAELTDLDPDDARSVQKVKGWLAKMGKPVASLRREEVAALFAGDYFGDTENDPVAARIEAAIAARQLASRATVGKVARVFSSVDPDARCRNVLVYHGAHTGRWSGRDLQPHNMPRPTSAVDVASLLAKYHATDSLTLDDVRAASTCDLGAALASLMRPIVCAPPGRVLVCLDYAQVEARGVMWLARDRNGLAAFADPTRDIYKDMAAAINASRQIGKIAVLGCGYGIGGEKFERFCELSGSPLDAVNLTGPQVVQTYRHTYSAVPQLWRNLDRAAKTALRSGVCVTNRCRFTRDGYKLIITLPSGRRLIYRGVSIAAGEYGPELSYDNPKGYRSKLYGGKIAENIVQAFCRDFLVGAMLRLGQRYPICLHVHDELVFEVDEAASSDALHYLCESMSNPPEWAEDFPLRVEGAIMRHYGKGKGIEYMRGEKL